MRWLADCEKGILDFTPRLVSIHTISVDTVTSEPGTHSRPTGARGDAGPGYPATTEKSNLSFRGKQSKPPSVLHLDAAPVLSPSLFCPHTYLSSISLGCSPPSKYSSNEIFELISESIMASISAPLRGAIVSKGVRAAHHALTHTQVPRSEAFFLALKTECACAVLGHLYGSPES